MGIGYCMVMLFMLAVCKTTRNCRRQEAEDFAQSMELCMRGAIVGLVPQEFPAQPSTRAACKGQHTTRARVKDGAQFRQHFERGVEERAPGQHGRLATSAAQDLYVQRPTLCVINWTCAAEVCKDFARILQFTHDKLIDFEGRSFDKPRSAPSFSFGSRSINELNTLACNRSFFCKNGTHRCTDGEILLDPLRRRDDKSQAKLRDHGRQWKAVPGPGSYRVPRFLGDIDQVREFSLGKSAFPWHAPSWSLDGQSLRPALYHTTGGVNGFYQREGNILRRPKPNITPGPAHYFKDSHCGLSMFCDYF
ncbi:unnamed protein product [Durusdinium trenchii]|uniref:Uncharacterized protein n=1 Tax=Durusdinium trenchii TaxID=1381693 RepID=A0ABP0RYU9_9DINO